MGNLATKSNMFVFHTYWGCIPSYWDNYYCFTVYASIKIHKLVKKSRSIMASAAKPGVVCQIQSSEPYISSQLGVKTHISRSTASEILHFYRGKPTRNRWLHRQGTGWFVVQWLWAKFRRKFGWFISDITDISGGVIIITPLYYNMYQYVWYYNCVFRLVYLFIYIWATACIWVNGE